MRSIQFWLIFWLLCLLALVMAVVSSVVHRETQQALTAKRAVLDQLLDSSQTVVRQSFEQQSAECRQRFDDELLRKAQIFTGIIQVRFRFQFPRYHSLGLLTSTAVPNGWVLAPGWIGQDVPSHLLQRVYRLTSPLEIQFDDGLMTNLAEGGEEYFQLFSSQGTRLQKSPSLEQDELPLSTGQLDQPALEHSYSEVVLSNGKRVRLVTFKAPVLRQRMSGLTGFGKPSGVGFPFWPRGGDRPGFGGKPLPVVPPSAQNFFDRLTPLMLLAYGCDTAARNEELDRLEQNYRTELDKLQTERESADRSTTQTLSSMRFRMLLLTGLMFLLTALGGVWLVRRGLSPIQRIADAVSRVNEKNFELHIAPQEVPPELAGIVEKLKGSLASLQKVFQHDRQAVADISHDLRTPITALLTTLQVGLRRERTPQEYRDLLTRSQEIGSHLKLLVERLLLLARLDAGVDRLQPELVDVPELTERSVEMIRPLAEAKGLHVLFERNGSSIVDTDPAKLHEILTNLLDNAIQYNRTAGEIRVRVGEANDEVCLEVQDSGIGMTPEVRNHLFERFYRADPSREGAKVNAGLGLAIVKGYLDLMGGRIEVESEAGMGSTFRIRLPRAKREITGTDLDTI